MNPSKNTQVGSLSNHDPISSCYASSSSLLWRLTLRTIEMTLQIHLRKNIAQPISAAIKIWMIMVAEKGSM